MRRSLRFAIFLVITVALVWALLTQVRIADIASAMASVGPWWLLASFVLYLLSTTLRATRFVLFLKGRIGLGRMLRIVYTHNLANNALPSFLGELSFVYLARDTQKVSTGEATAALIVSRLFDLGAVFGLTALALFFVPNAPSQFRLLLMAFGAALLLIFIAIVLVVVFKHRALGIVDKTLMLLRLRGIRVVDWGFSKLQETIEALESMHGLRTYVLGIGVSLAVWLLAYAQTYVLLVAMGYDISFMTAALGTSLYRIASTLPVYGVLGFGTVELSWAVAFVLLGMQKDAAIVSGFAVHIITLSYAVLLGVIATMMHGAKIDTTETRIEKQAETPVEKEKPR